MHCSKSLLLALAILASASVVALSSPQGGSGGSVGVGPRPPAQPDSSIGQGAPPGGVQHPIRSATVAG
jgi:hypothetical protein